VTPDDITALLSTSGTPDQLPSGVCAAEGLSLDWWCWRYAKLLGQVGNEQYFRCGQCAEVFRTGAA
jgi:hypothetical protein